MNPILLVVVGIIYVGVTIQYGLAGRPGMALAFGGYALAQVGFIMEAR